jgi:hypothetical protein
MHLLYFIYLRIYFTYLAYYYNYFYQCIYLLYFLLYLLYLLYYFNATAFIMTMTGSGTKTQCYHRQLSCHGA